jgi:predicted transcriptional regulator
MKIKNFLNKTDELVLLSIREEYYNEILKGIKKFEYRKKYNKLSTIAFIYISKTKKKVVAVIEFDAPIYDSAEIIAKISEKEKKDSFENMIEYIGRDKKGYAIPIKKIIPIENISLQEIKNKIPGFTVPQSFFYIKEKKELLELLENLEVQDV